MPERPTGYPGPPKIDSTVVYGVYGVLFFICVLGEILTYFGPFSVRYWECWAGTNAWFLEVQRALVAAGLSLFAIRNMGLKRLKGTHCFGRRLKSVFPFPIWVYCAVLVFFSMLLLVFIPFLGANHIEYNQSGCNRLLDAATIRSWHEETGWKELLFFDFPLLWRPYVFYYFYMWGIWVGMFGYFLHCVYRCVVFDSVWAKASRMSLLEELERRDMEEWHLSELKAHFHTHVSALSNMGTRYVVAILSIGVVLVHEAFILHTGSSLAQEAAKVGIWGTLGPALVFFVLVFWIRYEALSKRVVAIMLEMIQKAVKDMDVDALERCLAFQRFVEVENSPFVLLRSIFQRGSISVPLVVALVGYVVGILSQDFDWSEVFLPTVILEEFQGLYRGAK